LRPKGAIWETEVQRGFRISPVQRPERSESVAWCGVKWSGVLIAVKKSEPTARTRNKCKWFFAKQKNSEEYSHFRKFFDIVVVEEHKYL